MRKAQEILPEIIKKIEQSEEESLARGVWCDFYNLLGDTGVKVFPDSYSEDLRMPSVCIIIRHKKREGKILSEGAGINFNFSDIGREARLKERTNK